MKRVPRDRPLGVRRLLKGRSPALAEVAIAQPERTSTGMVRVIRTEIAASAEQLRSRNDSPVPAMLNVQRVPVGAVTKHPGVNNVFKMTMP